MGGGHHITRDDYDLMLLEKLIRYAQDQWDVEVYLEPGEAVALNAGYLACRVLDIVQNNDKIVSSYYPEVFKSILKVSKDYQKDLTNTLKY